MMPRAAHYVPSFRNIIGGTLTNVDNIITALVAVLPRRSPPPSRPWNRPSSGSPQRHELGGCLRSAPALIYLADRVTNKLFIDALGTGAGYSLQSGRNVGGLLHAFGAGAFIAINSGTVFGARWRRPAAMQQ
jgi:hypothetical protein